MGKMYVLNATGHDEITWKADDAATVDTAREEFRRLRRCGYLPFGKRRPSAEPQQLRDFDTSVAEIFWVRPVTGG